MSELSLILCSARAWIQGRTNYIITKIKSEEKTRDRRCHLLFTIYYFSVEKLGTAPLS